MSYKRNLILHEADIANTGRYTVSTDEDYESDSEHVLKNYFGIKSKADIEALEEQELERTELELLNIFSQSHQFSASDICNIHELWLGDIYPSAGRYRTVTMSKAGFPFAMPAYIAPSMQKFEEKYLRIYTPCQVKEMDKIAEAVGINSCGVNFNSSFS